MQDNNQTPDTHGGVPDPETNAVSPTTPMNEEAIPSTQPTESPVEVAHPEVPTPAAVSETPVAGESSKKQFLMQYGIAALVVLVMGTGLAYALEQQGRINTGVFDAIGSVIKPEPLAAKVNGTGITLADYEKNLTQLNTAATQQGADITNESIAQEIKTQAIDVLVNTELLRQEARKNGANVTAEDIDARYEEILTSIGGEEKLAAKMAELGITQESLRKDIEGEILIQGHLAEAVDTSSITVTEDDLKAAYAQISGTAATGVTVPPLEEIKTQLEAQLKTNKEQELVNAYITKLREGADIEVLI
ncbi:MAG: SurA N-terminal domain-containing protein [Patescibacteria group bacterium]